MTIALLPFDYTSDSGETFCLMLEPGKASLTDFVRSPLGRPKRPHGLKTRKERLIAASGHDLLLPYPTTTIPIDFGSSIVHNGVVYTAIETFDEVGTGVLP